MNIYQQWELLWFITCYRCVKNADGYRNVLPALLTVERDNSRTAVDVQAAKLTAQKLAENGIKGIINIHKNFILYHCW